MVCFLLSPGASCLGEGQECERTGQREALIANNLALILLIYSFGFSRVRLGLKWSETCTRV